MILHPEIVRGIRGTTVSRKMWEHILHKIYKIEGKDGELPYPLNFEKIHVPTKADHLFDTALYHFLRMLPKETAEEATKKFISVAAAYQSPVYRFGKEFFSVLSNVSLKNIPMSILPAQGSGFVSIPEFKNNICGFYYNFESLAADKISFCITTVYSGKTFDECMGRARQDKDLIEAYKGDPIMFEHICKVHSFMNVEFGRCMNLNFNLKPDKSIDEALLDYFDMDFREKLESADDDELADHMMMGRIAFNCILYIYSQQPNLQKAKTRDKMTNKQRKEHLAKGGLISEFEIPVTYVSWNYKKQIQYSVDSTVVESHPRWQPCGPGRSQVKLIWVAAHERRYKNVMSEEKTEAIVE